MRGARALQSSHADAGTKGGLEQKKGRADSAHEPLQIGTDHMLHGHTNVVQVQRRRCRGRQRHQVRGPLDAYSIRTDFDGHHIGGAIRPAGGHHHQRIREHVGGPPDRAGDGQPVTLISGTQRDLSQARRLFEAGRHGGHTGTVPTGQLCQVFRTKICRGKAHVLNGHTMCPRREAHGQTAGSDAFDGAHHWREVRSDTTGMKQSLCAQRRDVHPHVGLIGVESGCAAGHLIDDTFQLVVDFPGHGCRHSEISPSPCSLSTGVSTAFRARSTASSSGAS
ncbi:Uncharacterised protein [Mycobacteroides abscessus subsp. abscessus]|nr:Uncharacterised protein [Mycobacteroides abscessus subsp. abscessus]